MLAELSGFSWRVHAGGYTCEDRMVDGTTSRVVVPKFEDVGWHQCYPLEEPGLHRTFAALELTETAILGFAEMWGPLLNAPEYTSEAYCIDSVYLCEKCGAINSDEPEDEDTTCIWDPTDFWFKEIQRMKALIDLYGAIKDGHDRHLTELIEFQQREFGTDRIEVTLRLKELPPLIWQFCFNEQEGQDNAKLMNAGARRALAQKVSLQPAKPIPLGFLFAGTGHWATSQSIDSISHTTQLGCRAMVAICARNLERQNSETVRVLQAPFRCVEGHRSAASPK